MHIRKKWILALCCLCMACVMLGSTIGCAFNGAVDNSSNLQAPAGKLQNVTGQYDTNNLLTSNFNSSVTKVESAQTEIGVIVDLGGKGLYDIYDKTETFASFVKSSRATSYLKTLTKQQNAFVSALQKSGIKYTYKCAYTSVSNAVALRISSADYYKLGSIAGVKRVYRSEVYSAPQTVDVDSITNYTPVYSTGVYDSSEVDYKGDGMLVAVLDTGLDYTHDAFQTMPTGDKAWTKNDVEAMFNEETNLQTYNMGFSASDVYVNAKVPYAFDYADDDADVYPSYSNHGTHVAGIIAGQDKGKTVDEQGNTFIGVAPNAQLAIMKVFTDNLESKMLGGADSIDILRAIDDCAKLGVDVINMSLGSAGGFSEMPDKPYLSSEAYLNDVYDTVQEMGVSLIVAAGNEYSSGFGGGNGTNLASNPDSGTVGSPSTYESALSVASIEGQKSPYIIGNDSTVAFITNSSDGNGNEIDFIDKLYDAVNKWNAANGKEPVSINEPLNIPYVVIGGVGNAMNYTGGIRRQFQTQATIALVKRGDISFADKVQNAMDNGAVAVVIYNHLSGGIRMSLGDLINPIPACSIGLEAGTKLVSGATNGRGTFTISKDYAAGPFMSEFSSWGPTPSLKFKPEITAYGGKIMSAVPGGYDQLSGTSMAAPNMAGMVTLMRQYIAETTSLTGPDLNSRVYQMLMSTTTLVKNDEGNPYSPRKQGAGLGSLEYALSTGAYISVPGQTKTKIELLDDPKRAGVYELEFTVHNLTNGEISYMPRVYNMTETLAVDGRTVAEKSHMLDDTVIKVEVNGVETDGRVTVPASNGTNGGSVDVKITLTLGDAGRKYIEDSFKNGMYVEGFVRFEDGKDASNKDICDVGVPYLAFYGDWADAPMFDYTVFEISENENDSSIEFDDKIHATAAATTPLGLYDDQYIIALGSYVYTMEDSDVAINTSDERAAISIYNDDDYGSIKSIYEFYGVYAGLLRGAKEMDVSIVDTLTGEVVYETQLFNQRKSYAGGGGNYGSPVMVGVRPIDWDWNNNSQYEVKLSGRLDWKREGDEELVSPDKNEFSFKFTVDYEAPTVTDYRVRFEPYTENKETKYRIYMDVDVYDNQYSMCLLPCFYEDETLYSLTRYPLPIYSQKNEVTTVSFEITDYYEDYFKTGNFYLYPIDYAMNHSLYRVLPGNAVDYPTEILFQTDDSLVASTVDSYGDYSVQSYRLTLTPNQLYKLTEAEIKPEGAINHKLTWKISENGQQVKAFEKEIFAGATPVRNVILELMAGDRVVAKIKLNVAELNDEVINPPRLQSIKFQPVYNGDNYVSAVGLSLPLNNNTETQLNLDVTPWYYGDINVLWTSNKESVATVDQNGLVSTHATGTAWITATVLDDEGNETRVKASVQVVVASDYNVRNYRMYNYYGGPIVRIPEELNVMYLDDECFKDNTTITEVYLPNTLTEIPKNAFSGCTNLQKVVIPASCTTILDEAFKDCKKLEIIELSPFANKVDKLETVGSLTISISAFEGCTALKTIVNPERMTTLGKQAFYGCTGLTSVDISGARIVGEYVFAGCTNLTSVTMSETTRLGSYMFYGCAKLNNVDIKAQALPESVFENCSGLTNVTFDSKIKLQSIGDYAFANTPIQQITLPNGSYEIGDSAFSGCTKLTTVTLSPNTQILGELYMPFSGCSALKKFAINGESNYYSVDKNGILYGKDEEGTVTTLLLVPVLGEFVQSDLPEGVRHIGASAFAGNVNLTSITLDGFDTVGAYAFAQTKLTSVTIPEDWEYIPEGLFYDCGSLTSVTMNNTNVEIIFGSAFAGCSSLNSIELPDTVWALGSGAFMYCNSLSEINLDNVELFGSYCLTGTAITTLNAPSAEIVYDYAFIAMKSLTTAKLGPVKQMGEGVFMDIQNNTLTGNTVIRSVEFAEGATVVGDYTFAIAYNQSGRLTEVILPDTIETIGECAFLNRAELQTVNLVGVQSVGVQAFYNSGIKNVDLSSIKEFGMYSFAETKSLQTANLTNAVNIGEGAFEESGLTTLTIPQAATIDAFAFAGTKITTVEIPASLTYSHLDEYYKESDSGKRPELVEGKQKLSLMGGAFFSIPTLTAFTVEQGSKTYFAQDGVLYARVKEGYVLVQYPESREGTEYEVLEGTIRIGDYAFYGNTKLTKVTFPVSLKSIGAFAFYNTDIEGKIEREYVFKAVEAPILESIYSVMMQYVNPEDSSLENNYLIFVSMGSTVFYANFGNFAALVTEKERVLTQIEYAQQEGNLLDYEYSAPTYKYRLVRPENGVGYNTPVWNAYFTTVTPSAYAADRTTTAAIEAINGIMTADEIKAEVNAIADNDAKLAKLDEISNNSLQQARQAYNQIVDDKQKELVTEYDKLIAAERTVRELKAQCGKPVALQELRREGYYKTRYEEGEKFDPQDMKIVAIYADGSLLELTSDMYVLNKTGELKSTDTSVTITYEGKSLNLAIMVNAKEEPEPDHVCGHVCETCGKCTDSTCTNAVCADKCQGHGGDDKPQPANVGLIVGLSVGGVVVAAGVAVLVVMLLRKKKLAAKPQSVQASDESKTSETDETNKAE